MLEIDKKKEEDSNVFVHNVNFVNGVGLDIIEEEQSVIIDISVYKKITEFENCICKFKIKEGNEESYATGFFCYFPSKEIKF